MYYSNYLFRVIGQTVGPVVKLDVHTDCARRGRLALLAVCIDLMKSLVSKVKINDCLQRVEYESLPNICFKCGHIGHGVDLCTGVKLALWEVSKPLFEKQKFSGRLKNETKIGVATDPLLRCDRYTLK